MRSKTSFCSLALIRQIAFKRFWPIIAIYALILIFSMFLFAAAAGNDLRFELMQMDADRIDSLQRDLLYVFKIAGSILAMFIGILVARVSFGYLNQPNTVQFYHAMPLKRGILFWSNYIAGVLLFAVPILLTWAVSWIFLAVYGLMPYLAITMFPWLGIVLAVHLFFYSFAVIVGFLTGNSAAHVVIYGVFNFLAVFLSLMFDTLFRIYLYGYIGVWDYGMPDALHWFSPIIELCTDKSFWSVLIFLLIGAVLTVLSLLLYKRRRLEVAGTVIAVNPLRPIFIVGFAVCFTLLFVSFASVVLSSIIKINGAAIVSVLLLVFAFFGYYLARMLIMKTFNVFKDSLKGAIIFMAVVTLGVCTLQFDLTGFESRMPREEDVAFVVCTRNDSVMNDNYNARYIALGNDGRNGWYQLQLNDQPKERLDPLTGDLALLARKHAPGLFEEQANIRSAMDAHGWIIDNREAIQKTQYGNNYFHSVNIIYQMKDGSQFSRRFPVRSAESLPPAMEALYNSQEYITKNAMPLYIEEAIPLNAYVIDAYKDYVNDKGYYSDSDPAEYLFESKEDSQSMLDAQSLLDAIVADVRAGNAGQYYPDAKGAFADEISTICVYVPVSVPRDELSRLLDYYSEFDDPYRKIDSVGVGVTTRSTNILRWMEEHGIDTDLVYARRLTEEQTLSLFYSYESFIGSGRSYMYPETGERTLTQAREVEAAKVEAEEAAE